MKNWVNARLADLRARQEAGENMPCPRCGRMTMKPWIHTNALSRCADIYVCDECGANEALCAMMKNPLLPIDWECMKVKDPYVAESAVSYLPTIETHIPILEYIFNEWLEDGCPADFRAYRSFAMQQCPGVTQLWTHPFQIEYRARDNSRALIRFRVRNGKIEFSLDTFKS